MTHEAIKSKIIILSILILFMMGCGGNGENIPVIDDSWHSPTPDIVKGKIADTVMDILMLQTNPDQANITGRPRIRRKPRFLSFGKINDKARYKITTSFNNNVFSISGILYTFVSGYLTVGTYDYYGFPTTYLYDVDKIVLEWEDVQVLYNRSGRAHNLLINGTQIISGLLPTSNRIILEIQNYSETGTISGIYTDLFISEAILFFNNLLPYPSNESSLEAILNSNGIIYHFQCLFDGSYLADVSIDKPIIDSFQIDLTKGTVFEPGTGFIWSSIIEKSRNKVVLVRTYYTGDVTPSKYGTGCVISPNGVIITNNHVVSYGTIFKTLSRVTIEFYKDYIAQNGITYNVTGINYSDRKRDLAYLKLNSITPNYFIIGDSSKLRRGDDLLHIGHPETLEWWEAKGIFLQTYIAKNYFEGLDPTTLIFQHTAPANHGSSGGATINTNGELCGILSAGYPGELETKARIFAIHSKHISPPNSLTFSNLATYVPEYWILTGNEIQLLPGMTFDLLNYDNLTPMHEEDIDLNHYIFANLKFYDLDGNGYADHLKVFRFDYYTFEYFWIFAWDYDGDQFIDIFAVDENFDGIAN